MLSNVTMGMGHWALGMGHGALGMGHGALGMGISTGISKQSRVNIGLLLTPNYCTDAINRVSPNS
ncbi:hypothetical protein [Nostoc sp.]|uniref:hypothetical protein n=1 Tax=Nostoc sp. TaxID=1180 RepID=UPI002FFAEFAF